MRESLKNSVTPQEMLTMRDTGMTNAQIAAALDVTPQTVYRYIGKMPSDLRSKQNISTRSERMPDNKPQPPHTIRSALMIAARTHELRGDVLQLDVRTSNDGVKITWLADLTAQDMTVEQLETLRNELDDAIDAIRRVLK